MNFVATNKIFSFSGTGARRRGESGVGDGQGGRSVAHLLPHNYYFCSEKAHELIDSVGHQKTFGEKCGDAAKAAGDKVAEAATAISGKKWFFVALRNTFSPDKVHSLVDSDEKAK